MSGSALRPTLLAPAYWPEVRRGTERIVRLLADGLVAEGHRPRLVCGAPGRWPSRRRESGLDVVRVPRVGRRRLWRHRYDDRAASLPFAAPLLLADPGDLLHAFYPTDAVLAAGVVRLRGALARRTAVGRVPLVISVMGPPDRAWAVARRGRLEGIAGAARDAAVVIALSRFAADRLWRTFAVRSEVVHPSVDLDAFAPDSAAERYATPTLLFASDASDGAKRVGLALEALARLRRDRPDLRLLVDAPADPDVGRALAATPGVDVSDLSRPGALLDAYRRASVTVLPSVNEAFGLVVAESLACGTPAVCCAGEGPAEILAGAPEAGRVAAAPTAEALARAIGEALELTADDRARERCRDAVAHLGVAPHAARHLELYRHALHRA